MKKCWRAYLALLIVAILSGCTRNNGDIGPLFGTWRLDEITIDGEPDEAYTKDILWLFQTHVFSMIKVDDATTDSYQSWGSWEMSHDVLSLDFRHSDGLNKPGAELYSPFPQTHLAVNAVSQLRIVTLNGSKMCLSYDGADSHVYGYYLTKYK